MKVPREIKNINENLEKAGFQSYIVGGCVRDLLRDVEPSDWDIATDAKPEKIAGIFPDNFINNKFGTVTVITKAKNPRLKEVEITPYRIDEEYSDKRHPDKIKWTKDIEEDLSRRDFTVNALAGRLEGRNLKIIDLFEGKKDLENKMIRAVGEPGERFNEDALRLMRAVRFAVTLGRKWKIEKKTREAIKEKASLLKFISKERIRDELVKIIMSPFGARGIERLRRLGLLKYIIPELEEGFGIDQNKHHIYQIYQHNLLSLNYACQKDYSLEVRLAALLHDVGKPQTKEGEGKDATFYNHEIVGAKMAYDILNGLKFSKKEVKKITKLVRYHLFYYNVDEVGESSVRRLLRRVGEENVEDLMEVRYSDRIGSGVPKAEPYKLRHLKYMFEKINKDPISVKKLKVGGKEIMNILNIEPGPKIGRILTVLLGEVLGDPAKNNRTFLKKEIVRLGKGMSDEEFNRTYEEAKKEIRKIKIKRDKMTKDKYWVK